ncbi:hypothetical protein JQC91_07280 [Jannaschia sp. Os4]|uniref:hypothetical protein n=1 Tax=Jannaschia sp. Os4 TaxID=2807617 RepID=UPI001939788D|nr:hypothetical protein [Jannaschia sp. Os4]MBM2576103.1 hypothetical protein [Jannaschia sp. Os4]
MIAALPWYPGARPALDALWAAARRDGWPEALTWPGTGLLDRADLLLSQCCAPMWGMRWRDRLALVGAFDFGLPDTAPGAYRSVIVQRLDDRRAPDAAAAAGMAANAPDSQSGWGALADQGWGERPVRFTGSHAASMAAVAGGAAHVAAIDMVTWRLAPHPRLSVRRVTAPTPAPPLVTAFPDRAAALRAALAGGLARLPAALRRASGLRGVVAVDAGTYRACSLPAPPSRNAA